MDDVNINSMAFFGVSQRLAKIETCLGCYSGQFTYMVKNRPFLFFGDKADTSRIYVVVF